MADVINLNQYRKRKQRETARRRADANAVRHGLTAAERRRQEQQRKRQAEEVEGARRDEPARDDPE